MKIHHLKLRSYKRFTDLTISGLPETAKLVVLLGPNGSGKSSVFDAFREWQTRWIGRGRDNSYTDKQGAPDVPQKDRVELAFHGGDVPTDPQRGKRAFYIRSAYRVEPEFRRIAIDRLEPLIDLPRVARLIDLDSTVSNNYMQLFMRSVRSLYDKAKRQRTAGDIVDELIGSVRDSMKRVFNDLDFTGIDDPIQNGTFIFEKGTASGFLYKNLSAGEKAAFDLLLDFAVKREEFTDTVFCIDEPEAHMSTRLQSRLLRELYGSVNDRSQLWISTHSIGMMSAAKELSLLHPGAVTFLDFSSSDFDKPIGLAPSTPDRAFWQRAFDVALGDIAKLIAPSQVILCEGSPTGSKGRKAEFDARCYRLIFMSEFPDTDFISVGNASDVESDRLGLSSSITALITGTVTRHLIDRDSKSDLELAQDRQNGLKVLTKRHIESYLWDNEIITKFFEKNGVQALADDLIRYKDAELAKAAPGKPIDDLKSIAGLLLVEVRRLTHKQFANDQWAFMLQELAPLITSDTEVYRLLRRDIFD